MKLIDLTVTDFMQTLGSDEPAPGGGSASAVAATMGASLVVMVAELTVGKKKYAEYETEIQAVLAQAKSLQQRLLNAIDEDTEAFNQVSAVFSMPKNTEEEKSKRKSAMQSALKGAAQTPLDLMATILDMLKVTEQAIGKSNTNAASDLGVAALNLKSGLQGAWLNVLINLSGIKDEEFVATYKNDGAKLLAEGEQLANQIYQAILEIV